MSGISDIYDALHDEVKNLFPDKCRLTNPLDLDDNGDHLLTKGYGIRVDDGDNPDDEFCQVGYERTFGIIFTQEVISTENRTDVFDSVQKELLECLYTLNNKLCKTTNLGVCGVTIRLVNSEPISTIQGTQRKFLSTVQNVAIRYGEEII